jgi:type I restriction enzyme S subunit
VAEVEQQLSVVAEVEAALTANLYRAKRLRQSILKQAFTSRLARRVQDTGDKPASVLLACIPGGKG